MSLKNALRSVAKPEGIAAALLVIAFAVSAMRSPYFLDAAYLMKSSTLYVETGLIALGMTFVIVSGNIDLSVASTLTLSACFCAEVAKAGLPMELAAPLTLIVACLLGLVNGLVVVYARLPSFVVTLATMAIYRGIAQVRLGPGSMPYPDAYKGVDRMRLAGVPVSLIGLLVLALVAGFVLHRTVFGRWVVSVGANDEAARYAGLPSNRTKLLVFTIAGFTAGLAGLHIGSRLGYARFDHAQGLELDAITAVVLGGASIFGGRGTILGTVLAVFLVAVLRIGMGVANVKAEYQLAAIGTLLVLAVLIGNLLKATGRSRQST